MVATPGAVVSENEAVIVPPVRELTCIKLNSVPANQPQPGRGSQQHATSLQPDESRFTISSQLESFGADSESLVTASSPSARTTPVKASDNASAKNHPMVRIET